MFIPDKGEIVSKTYMTIVSGDPTRRVEGENTRLRHYLARLKRKTLCYSKSQEMLKHSIRLLLHYLKFNELPIPYSIVGVAAPRGNRDRRSMKISRRVRFERHRSHLP